MTFKIIHIRCFHFLYNLYNNRQNIFICIFGTFKYHRYLTYCYKFAVILALYWPVFMGQAQISDYIDFWLRWCFCINIRFFGGGGGYIKCLHRRWNLNMIFLFLLVLTWNVIIFFRFWIIFYMLVVISYHLLQVNLVLSCIHMLHIKRKKYQSIKIVDI